MTTPAVPPELLSRPGPQERRRLDRDQCAPLLDGCLRRLTRQDALCRRVLGRLAAAFLMRRAHLRLGFVRLADYARERLGLSGREFQELARVSRALEALPAIAQAFASGELSWSHVRLLVSVADAETESGWLGRARQLSVRGLRAAIAGRPVADDDDPEVIDGEARTCFRLRCPREVRRQWVEATELASRLCGTRLPAWRAAEERLGFSLRRARALLALDRVAQRCPELLAAYRDGRLSLARALVLLPVLQPETAAAWVTRATEVTLRRLEDSVAWALETAEPGAAILPPPAEGRLVLPAVSRVQMCARRDDAVIAFAGPETVVGLLWAVIHSVLHTPWRARLARAGAPAGRRHDTMDHPAAPARSDLRARWLACAVPGCTARSRTTSRASTECASA